MLPTSFCFWPGSGDRNRTTDYSFVVVYSCVLSASIARSLLVFAFSFFPELAGVATSLLQGEVLGMRSLVLSCCRFLAKFYHILGVVCFMAKPLLRWASRSITPSSLFGLYLPMFSSSLTALSALLRWWWSWCLFAEIRRITLIIACFTVTLGFSVRFRGPKSFQGNIEICRSSAKASSLIIMSEIC